MRDLHNTIDYRNLFPPKAAITDNTPFVSNIIDLQNSDAVEFVMVTGTDADADATFATTIAVGDDSALADGAAPPASDLIGTLAQASYTFADDGKTRKLGYCGPKRYAQVTVTPSNNTGNAFLAGTAAVRMKQAPTANPPTA